MADTLETINSKVKLTATNKRRYEIKVKHSLTIATSNQSQNAVNNMPKKKQFYL